MTDLIVAAVGSVAMLSAITLSIFGYRIATDFSSMSTRIAACETRISTEKKNFKSLRALSTLLARMQREFYVLADVSRRMIEDIGSGDRAAYERQRNAFMHRAEQSLRQLSRVGLFVALLDGARRATFADTLDELVTKYPDRDTITFLESIQTLLEDDEHTVLQQELPHLSVRVLGVDYTRWTGN